MKISRNKWKIILLSIIAIIIIFEAYCLISFFTKGNLNIYTQANSIYYNNSNIDVLVDVVDKDGKLINSKIKLQLYNNDGKKVKGAKTVSEIEKGQKGAVSLEMPENIETGNYNLQIIATSGIYREKTEIPINIVKDNLSNINISLDKGIYKPGDELNYRALILSNKNYKPAKQKVTIEIYDGNNNKVYSQNAETSEYGIVYGKFALADEVNSGTYKLSIKTDVQEVNKTFTVNPYITPQFETTISTDKENYVIGEISQITISSKYFFGEPVVNADVKGTINGEEIIGITDTNGNFNTTYEIKEEGALNLEFEIIDTSNYAVEASKQVYCGTDVFEIELLPEYGQIAEGLQNDIYVITKTASGEPVKTYSTIRLGKISKQVISDENGIGVFTLTPNESNEGMIAEISSEDMNSNKVNKEISLDSSSNGVYIKTDKIKYNAGDDIKVSLESTLDKNAYTIYVFKNKELLKIYSSDSNDFEFNLDDISGIIDIYTANDESSNRYQKRTIFIKPNKSLNINIETDKKEYSPGENLNIKFDTTNQEGQAVDSALLVSILDEAVLNLADNDLSIDNIKLALQDIELTDNITAADLYAEVLDESSDLKLNSVLLNQDSEDINIISNTYQNDNYEYLERAVIVAIIVLVVMCLYCFIKSNRIKECFIAVINVLFILALLLVYFINVFVDYTQSIFISVIINLVIAIIIYTLFLYRQKEYIYNMAKDIFLVPLIFFIAMFIAFILEFSNDSITLLQFIGFIILILFAIVINVILKRKSKNNKLSKIENILKSISESIIRGIIFWIAFVILAEVLSASLAFFILLVLYLILTKIIIKKPKINIQNGKIILNASNIDVIGIIFGMILMLVIIVGIYMISNVSENKNFYNRNNYRYGSEPEIMFETADDIVPSTSSKATDISAGTMFESATDSTGTSSGSSIIENFAQSVTSANEENIIFEDSSSQNEDTTSELQEIEKDIKTEENVRNVFLESLAFIPELVTQNGEAETSLEISDNITTWNIQTIGNTKDGEIGSATSSFKVFKEFFVDFSLPQNSVVTDKLQIPVTLYNYTENDMTINLNVKSNDWCNIGEYNKAVNVSANSTTMVYVPLEIIKEGNNTLRIESTSGELTDIVERTFNVDINGFEKEEIALTGTITDNYSQDMIFNENAIDKTKKIKVKLYPAPILQAVEGIEEMLKLPSGCFEQTSASLYPDVLVLKYLEKNNIDNQDLKSKALNYIQKGYQKLLTYEVKDEKGGYSLYGHSPAEPVITAFGLMEMDEISDVYTIDENILQDMQDYLFSKQKSNGSFDDINSTYIGGAENVDDLAMNAYITWALSEVAPEDKRLEKSINYLEDKLDDAKDAYTLALIANVFANTDNDSTKDVIKQLNEEINEETDTAYLKSNISDYYGSRGKYQNIQTTALFSMVLSKTNENNKTNDQLVNYLLTSRKANGTWGTTQSTILALKAINMYNEDNDISKQKLTVNVNGEEKSIDIAENALDIYELEFDNIENENKIEIGLEKGKLIYEIVKEYYVPYSEDLNNEYPQILVEQTITQTAKVNDTIDQTITVVNNSGDYIENGIVRVNIPQGCSVNEESLILLTHNGLIEKYEYNYGKINLYLRKFTNKKEVKLNISYKALYPEVVTAGAVIAYDYYNPDIQGVLAPVQITITE